jgi:hypothetical protein
MRTEGEILADLWQIAFADQPKGVTFNFLPYAWQARRQKWEELKKEAIEARKELEEKCKAQTTKI